MCGAGCCTVLHAEADAPACRCFGCGAASSASAQKPPPPKWVCCSCVLWLCDCHAEPRSGRFSFHRCRLLHPSPRLSSWWFRCVWHAPHATFFHSIPCNRSKSLPDPTAVLLRYADPSQASRFDRWNRRPSVKCSCSRRRWYAQGPALWSMMGLSSACFQRLALGHQLLCNCHPGGKAAATTTFAKRKVNTVPHACVPALTDGPPAAGVPSRDALAGAAATACP